MPGDGSRALDRLDRVLRGFEAAPAPLDTASLTRTLERALGLWGDLFRNETGAACMVGRPEASDAPALFGPCPPPGRDAAGYRAWHAAQGRLFLHYAPVAAHLLGPDSRPGERATTLLLADGLRLLRDHAAGLGRTSIRFDAVTTPALPFAHLVQRTGRPSSHRSTDVNLGAVALALAVESGMRHVLHVPGGARVSMWRLFRALLEDAGAVRLAVDLPTLVAVYNWAGRHRHAGARDYGWLNYWAADLLHPLFVPPGSLGFGLTAEPAVLNRLLAAAVADPSWRLAAPGEHAPPCVLNSAAA